MWSSGTIRPARRQASHKWSSSWPGRPGCRKGLCRPRILLIDESREGEAAATRTGDRPYADPGKFQAHVMSEIVASEAFVSVALSAKLSHSRDLPGCEEEPVGIDEERVWNLIQNQSCGYRIMLLDTPLDQARPARENACAALDMKDSRRSGRLLATRLAKRSQC